MNSKCMITLDSLDQLDNLLKSEAPFFIYKHSTRCNISTDAFEVIEETFGEGVKNLPQVYYLDLLAFREVSNEVERKLKVVHQSPQLILVKNGEAVWHMSHWRISRDTILEAV